MKLVNKFISVICATMLVSTYAMAGQAKVNWVDPDSYTDIEPGDEPRSRFEARVFKELEEHIAELAAKLPEGQTLTMDITNVDLAGDVRYMVGPNNATIRVIEDLYFPKMRFKYQLTDASGAKLSSGEEHIKDMGFFNSPGSGMHHENFKYEKVMLTDWFKETFMRDTKQ
ncbi:DUF3016 domain-containing protein [Thalassotalea sp. HSM 43]|uniref:DUF3016 domain-containing protein n=1 Tax=Thalassotalea sp. HSM 43 TaxID=2552945 RepID=UPI0010803F6F|nr:DUF3016 domain-containing protein [Thalassotalea sp. HSM 43]QBY03899.1 DUF3016 domain-containing protein [Thalassotalea sp. HSM 43]